MLKVALIGCGYWGKNLARNFYELGVLDTVCDSSVDKLNSIQTQYKNIKTMTDVDEAINSKAIKAVAIATPAVTHYELAKKAISRPAKQKS
jgi:UDP-2-acetamido-3-amino-2,3-dideoxy-glucuronate N-acetyltransferase